MEAHNNEVEKDNQDVNEENVEEKEVQDNEVDKGSEDMNEENVEENNVQGNEPDCAAAKSSHDNLNATMTLWKKSWFRLPPIGKLG